MTLFCEELKKEGQKSVYVVLMRSKSILSVAINLLKGDKYTHAAISLNAELSLMFSFGRRRFWNPFVGCFKRERLDDEFFSRQKKLPGVIIRIPINEKTFKSIADDILEMLLEAHAYKFNVWGMFLTTIKKDFSPVISYCSKIEEEASNDYFCSEFVYQLLREHSVADFGTPRGCVRPWHLYYLTQIPEARLIYEGDLLLYEPAQTKIKTTIPAIDVD